MTNTQDESQFQFVEWSDVSGPTKNAATRALIRKQAMSKAAAARKLRGDWGKKNIARKKDVIVPSTQAAPDLSLRLSEKPTSDCGLASPPTSVSSSNNDEVYTTEQPTNLNIDNGWRKLHQDQTSSWAMIPPKMACTDYELLRIESDFDVLDLSALTTYHVGRITTNTLHMSPMLLKEVLQCRQWSYISYVPHRFGFFPCLDDATRCVASRVRFWMKGEFNTNAATLSLYTKALDSLQVAINDPYLCVMPETLCATELLSLYELLNNTRSQGWAQHAAGAKSLLRLRGPQRFNTAFDHALFMAQLGPIYTEAIIEDVGCFLDEPEWQSVLKSVVDEQPVTISPFSDRGGVVISLWSYMVYLPNLWNAVQSAICGDNLIAASEIQVLQTRVIDLATNVSKWRSSYEPFLKSTPDPSIEHAKEEKRFETLGMCLICLLILKRLIVALDPLGSSAVNTEIEVATIAEDVLHLEKKAVANNPRAGLFMTFKKIAAQATLATTHDWRISSVVDTRVGANGLIAKWVFEKWCNMKGRRI